MSSQEPDPFDTLLTLEDTLYTTAYDQGVADGERAGRIEGRIFGLEKGFEKFASLGALHGRACVWGSRISSAIAKSKDYGDDHENKAAGKHAGGEGPDTMEEMRGESTVLNPLPSNPRLAKHISILHALTDPLTFSTENDEDAVADFDDRYKRAGAKAKIIERIVGETEGAIGAEAEGATGPKKGRNGGVKVSGAGKKDDSMEDFAGSRFLA